MSRLWRSPEDYYHTIGEGDVEVAQVGAGYQELAVLFHRAPEMREMLTSLNQCASLVLRDIDDQDTGWFYQLRAAQQSSERLLRTIQEEML